MKLNKTEIRDIKRYCKGFDIERIEKPNGQEITGIIIISNGQKSLHDSGYPYIKCIGWNSTNKKFYNLGFHDNLVLDCRTNVDCFGKNIFHIMNIGGNKLWRIENDFIGCSSLLVGRFCNSDEKEIIIS